MATYKMLSGCSSELNTDVDEPPDSTMDSTLPISFPKTTKSISNHSLCGSLLSQQLSIHKNNQESQVPLMDVPRPPGSSSSMAELTSDNDLTSPGTRPSSPSFDDHHTFPHILDSQHPQSIVMDTAEAPYFNVNQAEKAIEMTLGRRRCITFACGKPTEKKDTTAAPPKLPLIDNAPPKRKCALKFICPTRPKTTSTTCSSLSFRQRSPMPGTSFSKVRSSRKHRDSDATATNITPPTPDIIGCSLTLQNTISRGAEDAVESDIKCFHEFAISATADDEWINDPIPTDRKITVNTSFAKEEKFRRLGRELEEEEALEEAEHDAIFDKTREEEEEEDEENNEDFNLDHQMEDMLERSATRSSRVDAVSDAGFSTDDEDGFANSSENEDYNSDFDLWAPGKAANSSTIIDSKILRPVHHRKTSDSSLESARQANGNIRRSHKHSRRFQYQAAVHRSRSISPALPDSTDFVCGTLDEDKHLEETYKNFVERRKAAKHIPVPQDIDPSFPTSDPEMDDDDDVEDDAMRATLRPSTLIDREERGRSSGSSRLNSAIHSPRRPASPMPILPESMLKIEDSPEYVPAYLHSPRPGSGRGSGRAINMTKSFTTVSRDQSMTRPSSSSQNVQSQVTEAVPSRPSLNRFAVSMPRLNTTNLFRKTSYASSDDQEQDQDEDDDSTKKQQSCGAIDIVKSVAKQRERRRDRLYQLHCAKMRRAAEKKPVPGLGLERMRELGIELAQNKSERVMRSY